MAQGSLFKAWNCDGLIILASRNSILRPCVQLFQPAWSGDLIQLCWFQGSTKVSIVLVMDIYCDLCDKRGLFGSFGTLRLASRLLEVWNLSTIDSWLRSSKPFLPVFDPFAQFWNFGRPKEGRSAEEQDRKRDWGLVLLLSKPAEQHRFGCQLRGFGTNEFHDRSYSIWCSI